MLIKFFEKYMQYYLNSSFILLIISELYKHNCDMNYFRLFITILSTIQILIIPISHYYLVKIISERNKKLKELKKL